MICSGHLKEHGFKGATDAAFDTLDKKMSSNLNYYSLRNNYRTCSNLMKNMEKYFFSWKQWGLLDYTESVRPFNTNVGRMEMELVEDKNDFDPITLSVIDEALEELELDIKSGRKKNDSKAKVAVLVRGTKKAEDIANLCRAHGKTVVLNSDRPFFRSSAVRDFYALISSFIFVERPIYMYNYLMTPYASYNGIISIKEMEKFYGDERAIKKYLKGFMADTKWMQYQKEFRTAMCFRRLYDVSPSSIRSNLNGEGDIYLCVYEDKQYFFNVGKEEPQGEELVELLLHGSWSVYTYSD